MDQIKFLENRVKSLEDALEKAINLVKTGPVDDKWEDDFIEILEDKQT